MSRSLNSLLAEALQLVRDAPDVAITRVVQDHRNSVPGALFVARAGAAFDGRKLIAEAAALGAVAVVAEDSPLLDASPLPVIRVADAEAAVGPLAAALHGQPSSRLTVAGVTGTDGKTTTAHLLHHLLTERHTAALLSTTGLHDGLRPLPASGGFTTPEAPEVQDLLARAVQAGSSHAVLEASSHALDRHRLAAVEFDIALVTNLSSEHTDWHGSLENYLLAKRTLVERAGLAVLNRDDPYFHRFAEAASEVISYGTEPTADWQAHGVESRDGGIAFTVHGPGGSARAFLPVPGEYNALNALAALAAAARLGLNPERAVKRLASFPGVPGRMQVIQAEPFTVIVDFAHTGPGLHAALTSVRRQAQGRVILVIGAAGQRDHGKRAPLAQEAVAQADLVIFTEEDSRSEDTAGILAQLAAAASDAGARPGQVVCEPDRREAIRLALASAGAGDLVLLAGKGVERTLERKDEVLDWDEPETARELLRGLPSV